MSAKRVRQKFRVRRWLLIVGLGPLIFGLLVGGQIGCVPTIKKAEKMFTPSVESEKEMGRDFVKEAADQIDLVNDPELVEYVTMIGKPIIDAAQPMDYSFRFHIIDNPTINAFAVPGGHIYLFSGLLLKARNVNEVAGVMAHELAHVKHRHTAEMVGKGTLVNLATLAAVLLSQGNQAVATGAAGAGAALQLSFSREFEREADRYGLFYMYEAHYDPHGLLDFFDLMVREQRFSTSKIPPYLLTHPVTSERMANIEHLIAFHRLEVQNPRQMEDFYRFQGLLQAAVGEPTQLIPLLKHQVEGAAGDARKWHRLALAYDHNGWVQEALDALHRALQLDPQLYPAWTDLAALQVRMGRLGEASESLNRARQIRPDYFRIYIESAKMLIKMNELEEAQRALYKALDLQPALIEAHELLAKTYKIQGKDGEFHLQMASYWQKMDRTEKAVKQLKDALKLYGEDTEEGKAIKKRVEEIQSS
jgi:predicted Zn-dependent protease